jgi:hypothetical protein
MNPNFRAEGPWLVEEEGMGNRALQVCIAVRRPAVKAEPDADVAPHTRAAADVEERAGVDILGDGEAARFAGRIDEVARAVECSPPALEAEIDVGVRPVRPFAHLGARVG